MHNAVEAQSRKRLTNPVWGDKVVLLEEMSQNEEFVRWNGQEEREAEEGICKDTEA